MKAKKDAKKPLSAERLRALQEPDGGFAPQTFRKLLRKVKNGGMQDALRAEVWPLLLRCCEPFDSKLSRMQKQTCAEREYKAALERLAGKTGPVESIYARGGASEKFAATAERIHVDAVRVDKACPLFDGLHRETNVARMQQILQAYAVTDPSVGYCQGMADLLVPILAVFVKDSLAYWCFRGAMGEMRRAYANGMQHIELQLQRIPVMLRSYDAKLSRHLRKIDSDQAALRKCSMQMLLAAFTREIPHVQLFAFWEAMWAAELLSGIEMRTRCVIALLLHCRRHILACNSFEQLMQFVQKMQYDGTNAVALVRTAYALWKLDASDQYVQLRCRMF